MTAKEERMVGVDNLEWVRRHGEETPLRTALFWCRERLIDVVCGHGPELGDYEKCCREAVDMATAALAAKPRNCERFNDFFDAVKAYESEMGEPEPQPDTEEAASWWWMLAKWLFAPATKDEGDTISANVGETAAARNAATKPQNRKEIPVAIE